MTSVSAMNQQLEVYSMEKVHNSKICKKELDEILQMLKNMTLEDKKRLKGLQPKRADIITAGVVILDIIMEKLEKEVKILEVNKNELEKRLSRINAKKIEESLQQIYVYDLPSIYARFYDCLLQLKNIDKPYQYEICRDKLQKVLIEVDNLTTEEEQETIEQENSTKSLVELLNKTQNENLLSRFSDEKIVEIVKKYKINPNKWVRLRKTNEKTVLTIKHILNADMQANNNVNMQKVMETEMEVPSIEEANSILEQLGLSFRNYQEKNRITYEVDRVEVDIDTWPLIPTYVEIENDSTELIQSIIKKLELQEHEIVSCNTVDIYNKYGIDLYQFRELKF